MTKEIEDLKANQKMFSRALVEGDKHFGKLEDNIAEIKDNMIKVNYALFGNGVNGVAQDVKLILTRVNELTASCRKEEHEKSIKEIEQIVKSHEDIVKAAKGTLRIFKYLGLGGLIMVGMAIMHSLYNLALYAASLIGG